LTIKGNENGVASSYTSQPPFIEGDTFAPTSSEETEDEVTEDDEIGVPKSDEIKVPRADRHNLVSVKRVRVTEPWLFKLPRLVSDSENYPITASVTLGRASVFIDFEK